MSEKKTAPKAEKAAPAAKAAKAEKAPVAKTTAAAAPKAAPAAAKKKTSGKEAAPTASAPERQSVPPVAVFKSHSFRRQMIGVVTSDKMDKTVVVEVIRKARDQVYKKYIRVRDRYKAHDEENQFKVGDQVEITEHRPISRDKRWLVTRLVARRVEA